MTITLPVIVSFEASAETPSEEVSSDNVTPKKESFFASIKGVAALMCACWAALR